MGFGKFIVRYPNAFKVNDSGIVSLAPDRAPPVRIRSPALGVGGSHPLPGGHGKLCEDLGGRFKHWNPKSSSSWLKICAQTKTARYWDENTQTQIQMPLQECSATAFAMEWPNWGYATFTYNTQLSSLVEKGRYLWERLSSVHDSVALSSPSSTPVKTAGPTVGDATSHVARSRSPRALFFTGSSTQSHA